MSSTVIVIAFLVVLGIAFSLLRTWYAIRSLRERCAAQWVQLQSSLEDRHLIISHLSDSLPETFDCDFDRDQLGQARERAEAALHQIDPAVPNVPDLRVFSGCEQDLQEWVENLSSRIEAVETVRDLQPIFGCLEGLKESNKRIDLGMSTYNAATITYNTYLERLLSSFLARNFFKGDFGVVDLSPKISRKFELGVEP